MSVFVVVVVFLLVKLRFFDKDFCASVATFQCKSMPISFKIEASRPVATSISPVMTELQLPFGFTQEVVGFDWFLI